MPARTCDYCGTAYQAKRSTSRYCTDTCRTKAAQLRAGTRVLPAAPVVVESGVLPAVRAELARLGLTDSVAGAAALSLAGRIDAQSEPGAAMAAMVRELRATMAEASAGATVELDVLDELRARREARRGA